MPTLGKLWAGKAYGTNIGNLFIELQETGPKISGTFRFLDNQHGICIYSLEGSFDGKLVFEAKPTKAPPNVILGEIHAEARLTPEGNLRGQWNSTIGTGGTFEAYPHDINFPSAIPASPEGTNPEQFFIRNAEVGAIRLFADDVRRLLTYIREDFSSGRVVVTYKVRGNQVSRFAEQFLAELQSLDRLNYLKINIQEPEAQGLNRVATVELTPFGSSGVQVQGIRESWVMGKTEALVRLLYGYQSSPVTTFRKYGVGLNHVLLVVMLVVMPSLASWQDRTLFAVTVAGLWLIFQGLHARFVPNTVIYLGTARPTIFSRAWPTLISWIGAILTGLVGKLLYDWLASHHP